MRQRWHLSPAFNINPSINKAEHTIALTDHDRQPDIDRVLSTAALYRLTPKAAKDIVDEVRNVVEYWRSLAAKSRIALADIELIELMAGAFSALDTKI